MKYQNLLRGLNRAALLCLGCALAACASAPIQFYTLHDGQASQARPAGVDAGQSLRPLYLASLSLPERVDRPQLVVRKSAEQVQILEQHVWAEPLKQAFGRGLAAELRTQGFDLVASRAAVPQLSVTVLNFEAWPGKEVLLEVEWQVKDADGKLLLRREMSWRETSLGADTAALVAAHRRALAQCGLEIAKTLRTLPAA
jgi:uncharacterized protein